MSVRIPRRNYANLYGPTTGDRVRLADTDLIVEVERDFTVYGDEIVFGSGKVIRDGMGQSSGATRESSHGTLDVVITNALVIDHWGVVKGDIGVKDGRIVKVGKAGNPDTMDGVDAELIVGAATEVIAGENRIVTAGAVDAHMHFVSPQQVYEAISSGVTTMIGGGTGLATGGAATGCTPGAWNIRRMIQAAEAWPMNFGFLGKGNASLSHPLAEQIRAGACGLKLHEDWGSTPAAIDTCLHVADEFDIQVAIDTGTFNEPGYIEDTLAAIAGRAIHADYAEGDGHAPGVVHLAAQPNVLPSSTNPTGPVSGNAIAGDILHDLGVFSMISSGSQSMGRAGGGIARAWQTAHKMKAQRGPLPEDSSRNDNFRVKRYIAKYTINPAIAHGMARHIGSIEPGRLADLVLWKPAFFGVKPETIVKGGLIAWSAMGDAGGSITAPQPVLYRPMFGSSGRAAQATGVTFVSKSASLDGLALRKETLSVSHCRDAGKKDMVHNSATPAIEVDPKTREVRADGVLLACERAHELPLAQRYFLF